MSKLLRCEKGGMKKWKSPQQKLESVEWNYRCLKDEVVEHKFTEQYQENEVERIVIKNYSSKESQHN